MADAQNNAVLIFNHAIHKNGAPANVVLGQTDFAGSSANIFGEPTAATLYSPWGMTTQPGAMWVGDSYNSRTLQITPPISSGMNASLVLGQPDLVSGYPNQTNSNPSAQTQDSPFGPGFFEAGPSLLALAVLGILAIGFQWIRHRRQRA